MILTDNTRIIFQFSIISIIVLDQNPNNAKTLTFQLPTLSPEDLEEINLSFPDNCPGLARGTEFAFGVCSNPCSALEDCLKISNLVSCCPCRNTLKGGNVTQNCIAVSEPVVLNT